MRRPIYIPDTNTLAFSYVVLPSNATFPAVGGTVNQYASASSGAEGNGATTLPYVVPGSTTFYNARWAQGPHCMKHAACNLRV